MVGGKLFPSKCSVFVFIAYMALFVNQGILITASKTKANKYKYNTLIVVLLTECLKLIVSVFCYIKGQSVTSLVREVYSQKKILLFYFIPASLYCLYNNLQFLNLETHDPTTYYLLLQLRVVITGLIYQGVFGRRLSRIQWMSLILLTFGCFMKEFNRDIFRDSSVMEENKVYISVIHFPTLLILLQVFSSCFAGVYTEYLLKEKACDIHIMMQNIFMYLDSVFCCIFVLSSTGVLLKDFHRKSLESVFKPTVIAIILNSTAIGVVVSFFLKSLNSILKNFASALEVAFTALLCWPIFGIPIDFLTFLSICIVFIATFLYARNPIVNASKTILPSAS